MKKRVRIISFILSCIALSGIFTGPAFAQEVPDSENLMQNPGFETGTIDGWELSEDTLWVKQPIIEDKNPFVHSGTYAAAFVAKGEDSYVYQSIIIPETGEYEFSVHLLTLYEGNRFYISAGGSVKELSFSPGVWNKVTVSFYAVKGTVVQTQIFIGESSIFVDDASLCLTRRLPNLLQNPGFENGLEHWKNRGDGSIFSTTEQAASGSVSAYFGYFAAEPLNSFLEQSVSASPGGVYSFMSKIKTLPGLSGVGGFLLLEAKDINGMVLLTAASNALADSGGGWQTLEVTLTAPPETASVTVKIGGLYCTGAFLADDAVLTALQ